MTIQYATAKTDSGCAPNALDYIRDGVIIVGGDRHILHVDDALCRMLGVRQPDEVEAIRAVVERIQISGARPIEAVVDEVFESGRWQGNATGLTEDNHAIYLEVTGRRFSVRSGAGAILVVRNVTRDRLMENRVLDSQQMELVDTLSRGIAHEYKNLLTIILAYASMLQMSLKDEEALDEVGNIIETAERANELTQRLVSITRRASPQPRTVGLDYVIGEVAELTGKAVPTHVRISITEAADLPAVCVDPGMLVRAIIHLVFNAFEAMPGGGWLHLDVECVTLAQEDLEHHPADEPGTYAAISVTDTGHGISGDVEARMFEPFYTTKENGSGLGLPTVQKFAAAMKGWLSLYSEPGRGTCAKIYLPVARVGGSPVVGPGSPVEARRPLTVLIVDDDADMIHTTRRMLERAGHTVMLAPGGAEAISTCLENAGSIDVVLLDVVMPGVNGREVYFELGARLPGLPILITSGFPKRTIDDIMGEEGIPYISKPYTRADLARALEDVVSPAS